MNKELSPYAIGILDHIKTNKRQVGGLGNVSSREEFKVAFGGMSDDIKNAIAELVELKFIRSLQGGTAYSITPLGKTYRQPTRSSKAVPSAYISNDLEVAIMNVLYEKSNKGHEKETIEGLIQLTRRGHKERKREQVSEAIRILIYQKFLDAKDTKTSIPVGTKKVGERQQRSTVTTHYVSLSGKALMLLSRRGESSGTPAASVHVAENPYTTRRRLEELFASAKSSIKIVDAYIGRKTLDYLLSAEVPVSIITSSQKERNFDGALGDFVAEFQPGIEIKVSTAFHGRFVILDDTKFYVLDHSIKDFGSKPSSIVEMVEPAVIEVYKKLFTDNWV